MMPIACSSAPTSHGTQKPMRTTSHASASRLTTARIRPWRPGTCPKYSAVAQPSANEAERLTACQAMSSTNGRNGMLERVASDVPIARPPREERSVQGERLHGHDAVDPALPLVAGRVAVQLDL